MATKGMDTLDAATLQAMLGPELTAEQAALIFQQGQDAVVLALLTLAKQLAEKQAIGSKPDPTAPSGQTPPYIKAAGQRRAKAKDAKPGHPLDIAALRRLAAFLRHAQVPVRVQRLSS